MGLTTPIIVVYGGPSVSKESAGTLNCGRAGWGSRPSLGNVTFFQTNIFVHPCFAISALACSAINPLIFEINVSNLFFTQILLHFSCNRIRVMRKDGKAMESCSKLKSSSSCVQLICSEA